MLEEAIILTNPSGQTLVGVWHQPEGPSRAILVFLHGWTGYRTGPHQMLTRAARQYCEAGFAVLRFDFAGRGDSQGDADLATLATMSQDTIVAMEWCQSRSQSPLYLVGLCSGCEVAVATANASVAGVVLWSAPIFAELPSQQSRGSKKWANLKAYGRKLTKLATWRKLLTGQVDRQAVGKAVAGGGGAAARNRETGDPGQLPHGFRAKSLDSWHNYHGPIFATYGSADPIAVPAAAWYEQNSASKPNTHWIAGANHSYYGLSWEAQVLNTTLDWLQSQ